MGGSDFLNAVKYGVHQPIFNKIIPSPSNRNPRCTIGDYLLCY